MRNNHALIIYLSFCYCYTSVILFCYCYCYIVLYQQQPPGKHPLIIRVITETRNLKTQPFVPKDDQITTGKAWEKWLEEVERELRYFKISDPADKTDALIIYGGKEIARLEKSLPNPSGELDEYIKL